MYPLSDSSERFQKALPIYGAPPHQQRLLHTVFRMQRAEVSILQNHTAHVLSGPGLKHGRGLLYHECSWTH